MLRTIHLPAIDRTVSLAAYNQAIRLAKAFPTAVFKTSSLLQHCPLGTISLVSFTCTEAFKETLEGWCLPTRTLAGLILQKDGLADSYKIFS
jgi:hypothetical protein